MAAEGIASGEVVLSDGASASVQFHRVLQAAVEAYPTVFDATELGSSADEFKQRYADLLPVFEAVRADSDERCEIAATLDGAARSALAWRSETGEVLLAEHLAEHLAEPLTVESRTLGGNGSLRPRVPRGGVSLEGSELVAYARELAERGSASDPVVEGIGWIVDRAGTGGIDLRDRRVVVLGAAAELAPTRLWLEGGADVLWIDVTPPRADLLASDVLSGSVHWAPEGADLLAEPHRIRATIEDFAGGGGVDVGLYAYAPGRAREWRLAGAMNAIVDALPADIVRTITLLVSATTCGALTPGDLAGESRRREERPGWQAALDQIGLLGRGPGHSRHGETCTNRGIVPIQGSSYQAAQYLGKLMAAETWATSDRRLQVSANTAGISRTASVSHPVFDTAFGGAKAFGVETFEPATTASLNGLLTLRALLDPTASTQPEFDLETAPDRARALTATRVHGGIYELPYPIEPTLRVATALGVARDPRRIGPLLRRG